jgi:hypothetical protein
VGQRCASRGRIIGPGTRWASLADQLTQVLDELGIVRAHFCAQAPEDLLGLLAAAPTRVASLTLVGANAHPDACAAIGPLHFWITEHQGPIGGTMQPRLTDEQAC